MSRVSQGDEQLTVRMQGPYADPPAHAGQPDGVVLVAGEAGAIAVVSDFLCRARHNNQGHQQALQQNIKTLHPNIKMQTLPPCLKPEQVDRVCPTGSASLPCPALPQEASAT